MVVSDTSPLNYLILIEQINLLPQLYRRVLIPPSVREELNAREAPDRVRKWSASLPGWLEVSSDFAESSAEFDQLHEAERDAILLALRLEADAVIIDERRARAAAERRRLRVIGTLGVLVASHERGLVSLTSALELLWKTTFRVSPKLLAATLMRDQKE